MLNISNTASIDIKVRVTVGRAEWVIDFSSGSASVLHVAPFMNSESMKTWCHASELTLHVNEAILDLLSQSDASLRLRVAKEIELTCSSEIILGRLKSKIVIISGLFVEYSEISGAESASALPSSHLRGLDLLIGVAVASRLLVRIRVAASAATSA